MKLRTHKSVDKSLLTTEGYINYRRYILRPQDAESAAQLKKLSGSKTVVPLDIALGTDSLPFKITVPMMLEMSYWAAKMSSYQDTEEHLLRTHGIKISDDTIRQVVNYLGRLVFEEDCREADQAMYLFNACQIPDDHSKSGVLYLQTDGAAVNTRSKDENNSSWRENKLALAFSSDNIHYWTSRTGEHQHRILKREYVSFIGSVQDFRAHFLALALRSGYGHYRETILLSDGATWIRSLKEEVFPDAQQILNLFHLKENTYAFAKAIFHADPVKYNPWAEDICNQLEDGKWQQVLRSLAPYRDMQAGAGFVNLYTYIDNNKNNIDYPLYKRNGWFVGSGTIESSNKIVMQNRLKPQGVRWNTTTAQYMLSLKAKLESGLWDTYVVPFIFYNMLGERP